MSGSLPTPAEQHLGDRLAALVDGELGHDTRERVLAHLATCPKCKVEADAQRRLKNVFAEAAPPGPSESFLARLQGLPAGGEDDDGPFGGDPDQLAGRGSRSVFGARSAGPFGYAPAIAHAPVLSGDHGFRIHDVGRHEADRSASRGRRFAFAAAGAVSLAAIALGGVSATAPVGAVEAPGGSGSGSNVTPVRSGGTGAASGSETSRRRPGPLLAQGGLSGGAPVSPVSTVGAQAPLVPGPPGTAMRPQTMNALTAPLLAGASAMSPLTGSVPPDGFTSAVGASRPWAGARGTAEPVLSASPDSAPTVAASSRTVH